ncbi:MAG: hypothetical protein HY760_04065 [Nitrospirae bacterium]|nr:hypothetical protein [Nitrospirota bacterium]
MHENPSTRLLKDERPEIKVLFISGYAKDTNDPSRSPEPGVPFLQKPFTPQTLARKVWEVLDDGAF